MVKGLEKQVQKAPKRPGIYVFKNKSDEVLYIGKATNLKNRTKQYLRAETYSPFLDHLLNEATKIEYKTTNSEIEALLLESQFIKKIQPKYNIMLRDDKQYFYVVLTNDEFPKIFLTHQPSAAPSEALAKEGPFTDGTALKITLRLLRRIFPYCTCKQKHNNYCLNYHIGKCLGFCCLKSADITESEIKKYKRNVKTIKDLLSGKKNSAIKELEKELKKLGKEEKFQEAIELRNKIEKLKKIFENAKIISESESFDILKYQSKKTVLSNLKNIFKLPQIPVRIEGYDVSNIQGKNAVGAMVVFQDGQPDKNEYRKFKIRFKKTPDDIAMLKEILTRRFNHPEWSYPDLIFIDGGIAQLNIAIKTTNQKFPVISLAKGKNEVFSSSLKRPLPIKKLPNQVKNLIYQIDKEAHRFAISYYRKLHRYAGLPKPNF